MTGHFVGSFDYRYAVVDGDMNVVRWDAFVRHAHFAPAMPEGRSGGSDDNSSEASGSAVGYGRDKVEIQDTWEFQSHPENLFARESFRDVVLDDGSGKAAEQNLDALPEPSHDDDAASLAGALASLAIDPPRVRDAIRVRLEVRTLRLTPGQRLTATGDCTALGGWERDLAPVMNLDEGTRTWWLDFDVAPEDLPVRYKYALKGATRAGDAMEKGTDRIVAPLGWIGESRDSSPGLSTGTGGGASSQSLVREKANGTSELPNGDGAINEPVSPERVKFTVTDVDIAVDPVERATVASERRPGGRKSHHRSPSRIIARDGHFRYPGVWRGSGLAAPVFSLRSCDSVGAGDFVDLKTLVDVAHAGGMNVVQLLPVNDTTVHNMWWDSYPYSSVSVFALHPLYLRIQQVVSEAARAAGPEHAARFASLQAEVNKAKAALDLKEVDYEATVKVKMSVAKRCFEAVKNSFLNSPEFTEFLAENAAWLKPYAVFCALRELFGTAQHWRWGSLGCESSTETVTRLSQPGSEVYNTVALHYFVQFHLDAQLRAASAHAKRRGVILKGDLPIGVDKASVDTWMYPSLFRMHTSTGAPPDDFDPNGQNWGFPTYNWEEMSKDGYGWWRARMSHLERYFSAMRIDHVLGFFRIWELPAHTRVGRMGRFRPSVPIRRHELEQRGLWFVDRLCEPHVTSVLLKEIFGDRDGEVAGRFMEETGSDGHFPDGRAINTYRFKNEFVTEEGLLGSDAFKIRDGSPDWLVEETEQMRKGLLHLQHNVCLLRDPEDPDAFYPRIEMQKTSSFDELEGWSKDSLNWLYDDYFGARQDTLWRDNARRTLPALMTCTGQLVCGEDLGMVPPCVPPVLDELGILGLRIQRMPHDEGEFGRPNRYPYATVCSPSCHDTTTTRAWYETDRHRRARYAHQVLGMQGDGTLASSFPPPMAYRVEHVEEGSGAQRRRTSIGSVGVEDLGGVADGSGDTGFVERQHPPPDKCEPHVMRAIVRQHMASPSALAVFPAQDLLALEASYAQRPAEEETINDPTNNRHYWRFRLHVRLEDMLANSEWLADIRELVNESGRQEGKLTV